MSFQTKWIKFVEKVPPFSLPIALTLIIGSGVTGYARAAYVTSRDRTSHNQK